MTAWGVAAVLAAALMWASVQLGRARAEVTRLQRLLHKERQMREGFARVQGLDADGVRDALLDRVRAARGDVSAAVSGDGGDGS
jgi:hypothetical protein